MFSDRFSRPLSPLFRTFNLLGQLLNYVVVMADGRKPKPVIERDVFRCGASIFLPEAMALFTTEVPQGLPLSVSQQRGMSRRLGGGTFISIAFFV
jgi:hypothetical protein